MKKIIALLLAIFCILASFNVSAAGADNVVASGYIEGEKVGNIFSVKDETLKFKQEYENIGNETVNIQSEYQVMDEENNLVKEYPAQTIEIPAGENASLSYIVDNPGKFGIYTLKVVNNVMAGGVSYTDTYEESFSVCIDLYTRNVDSDFGFAQHIISKGYGDADVTPTLMRNAGANWYREDSFTWSMVEKSKGVYVISAEDKEKLQKIKDSGLEILLILNGINGLYNFPSNDESIDAFVAYCEFVAKELDGIVDHFEVWNEWNLKRETDTVGYYKMTDLYANVLKRAYDVIKAVNENNTVIGCATAGIEYEWIDGVLTNLNGTKAMDAVSVHCYPWTETEGVNETELITDMEELRKVLKKHSVDIPVWITEIGFSTFEGETVWLAPCSREQQLNSLVLVNAMNKAYGWFDKLIQYSFHDRANVSGIESNWGIVNCWQRGHTENPEAELTPYGAKPAYLGVAAMNYFIGGNAYYQELIKDSSDRAYMVKFKNNNIRRNVMLCINGDINSTVKKSVELDTNNVKIYDKYGNFVEEVSSETGVFSFDITEEPMYVTWTFEGESEEDWEFLNLEIDENTNKVTIRGNAEVPGDLVSVAVVSSGTALDSYDSDKVLFIGQATTNDLGEYSVSFVMPEFVGQFEVYANSKMRREKLMEDLIFSYSIPEIKVMQKGTDVYSISDIDLAADITVQLRGFEDLSNEKPVLIIAQYSGGKLVSAQLDDRAVGDCTKIGDEIEKSFTALDGIDKIKVMYMNINNIKPFVAAYEIK